MSEDRESDVLRELAIRSLASYKAGRLSLRRLVDDLDTVWSNLEPSDWREDFRGHWWTLEQVYAVAVDRGDLESLPQESLVAIDEATTALELLLDSWQTPEDSTS
jgi:hypothetical protein